MISNLLWKAWSERFVVDSLLVVAVSSLCLNILIWIYYNFKAHFLAKAAGEFCFASEKYTLFLEGIVFPTIIVLLIWLLKEYFFDLGDKFKFFFFSFLIVDILWTLPTYLFFFGSFYAYMKGREVLAEHWDSGTFRRLLNENERTQLVQETVQDFLEKTEASKEVKAQLKAWANQNIAFFQKQYDAGSSAGTKSVLDRLTSVKESLQSSPSKDLSQSTPKDQQGWWSWISDQTQQVFNYLSPLPAWEDFAIVIFGVLALYLWILICFPPPSPPPSPVPVESSREDFLNYQFQFLKIKTMEVKDTIERQPTANFNAQSYQDEMVTHGIQIREIVDEMCILRHPEYVEYSGKKKAEIVNQLKEACASGQLPEAEVALNWICDTML